MNAALPHFEIQKKCHYTNTRCNYDGGDCCLINVDKSNCSKCSCQNSGVITFGFPKKVFDSMDLTWMIEVAYGQFIKINFISFVVVDYSTGCGI